MRRLLIALVVLCLSLPTTAQHIDVGFSPQGSAEALVFKTIESAKCSIRMASYSFTSLPIVEKLVEAQQRGVDVKIVVDEKSNRSKASQAAIRQVILAGIPLRTNAAHKIHHDKYIIVDDRHIETGSFNYSRAAALQNSENVIVVWDKPEVAQHYLQHWQSRWEQGNSWCDVKMPSSEVCAIEK